MIYATIFVALILIFCLVRIYFLNSEIRDLDKGAGDFLRRIQTWQSSVTSRSETSTIEVPKDVQEAQTEYEWAINARDSKKESRTVWFGASVLALVAFIAAIVALIQK